MIGIKIAISLAIFLSCAFLSLLILSTLADGRYPALSELVDEIVDHCLRSILWIALLILVVLCISAIYWVFTYQVA